jgi:hypothetical protein
VTYWICAVFLCPELNLRALYLYNLPQDGKTCGRFNKRKIQIDLSLRPEAELPGSINKRNVRERS